MKKLTGHPHPKTVQTRGSAATLLLLALAFSPLTAVAQSDTFDDGNDAAPSIAWQRYNPLTIGTFSFPGGNSYRIQSPPSPDPANFGQARAGSVAPANYTNFYVSADIVGWDDSIHQIAGVMARLSNVGPGTTRGYLFTHDRGNPGSSTAGDMDIVRLDNEVPTSLTTTGSDGIHFEPGKTYRLVFIGVGTNLLGEVYELPNLVNPVVSITASDTAYASGAPGVVVANNAGPAYDGPADVTFDNFVADVAPKPADNFDDGNDTAPAPAWVHYNPINEFSGLPAGEWSFPAGAYRMKSPASPDKGAIGPAREGSLRPGNFTDFYVAVDIVNWDDTLHQISGLLARVQSPGLGTTSGYMFTHDRGDPSSQTSGDMDIVVLTGETGVSLPNLTGSDSIHFEPGKQYRLVFMGQGNNLTGQVYELPNLSVPVVNITASDATYASGASGLVVADNPDSTANMGTDVTFDNFIALNAEPRLSFSYTAGTLQITWPVVPLALESSPSLTAPVWIPVSSGITVLDGQNTFTTTPNAGPRFYRLGAL